MSDVRKNWVWDTSVTEGTGAFTILGVAAVDHTTVEASLADGESGTFLFRLPGGAREISRLCVWNAAGNTLSRGTFVASTTGSRINFGPGTKDVVMIVDAGQMVTTDGFDMTGRIGLAPEVAVTAATTAAVAAANSNSIILAGVTTTAGFDATPEGTILFVRHTGGHVLTHHATSFILRGNASITTAANDESVFRSLGSGDYRQIDFSRAAGPLADVLPSIHSYVQAG